MTAATGEQRPVRVTVDGWATTMTDSHGEPTHAVRVRYDAPERQASILLLTNSPSVTVEDRPEPRTWTDGDVVQCVETDRTRVRGRLSWPAGSDRRVSLDVENGDVRVLRYQAGE